jgi:hypothetical protein
VVSGRMRSRRRRVVWLAKLGTGRDRVLFGIELAALRAVAAVHLG